MKSWFVPGLILAALFAVTRLPAWQVQFHDTDVNLYALYAAEFQTAERRGESFYELHRQRAQSGGAEYQSVEYPPLAITLMRLPAWLIQDPFEQEFPTGLQPRFTRAYMGLMAGFDVTILVLVVCLVCRFCPKETPWEQLERCLIYVLCSWPLYGVLYTRLDLGVAALVMAALALLVCRVHWSISFAVLTLAIHFKLMPAVLAPLWLVGSLPVAALNSWQTAARGLLVRSSVLIAMGLTVLTPYYLTHGQAILEFLVYHKDRGIEIESTWASLLLLLGDYDIYHSHGSVNIRSPWSPLFTQLTTPAMATLLLASTVLFTAAVYRRRDEIKHTGGQSIAQSWPQLTASFAMLLLFTSIVVNKVFSPQYLLWVLPLIPLVDLPRNRRRCLAATMLVACLLTMRIFPDCFIGEIVRVVGRDDANPLLLEGPTSHGKLLLLARNGLAAGIFLSLVFASATRKAAASGRLPSIPRFTWRLWLLRARFRLQCGRTSLQERSQAN